MMGSPGAGAPPSCWRIVPIKLMKSDELEPPANVFVAEPTVMNCGPPTSWKAAGRARGWRAPHEGPQAGHGRHHRAAQGHHVSDRRQVAACRDPGPIASLAGMEYEP